MAINEKTLLILAVLGILAGFFAYSLAGANTPAAPNQTNQIQSATGKLLFGQAVGQKAPDFSLQGIDGKITTLSDYRGKNVVLFFNEGSMCYPACWDQIAAFGNDARFNSDSTQAFSIVVDSKTEWQKIIAKMPKLVNARILFDTARTASKSYDVMFLQSSMHRGSLPGHTYFIIDRNGIIRYARDDSTMSISNDLLANEITRLG